MTAGRMEAFSDGVLAIIITIMVLELHQPEGTTWKALHTVWPSFLGYVLSFVFVGIYWVNHHHLLKTVDHVTGGILWANLDLLFWLSLFPFVTSWMSATHFATVPVVVYGIVLCAAGIAYFILQQVIIRSQGPDSALAAAVGRDVKGKASIIAFAVGVAVALVFQGVPASRWVALVLCDSESHTPPAACRWCRWCGWCPTDGSNG